VSRVDYRWSANTASSLGEDIDQAPPSVRLTASQSELSALGRHTPRCQQHMPGHLLFTHVRHPGPTRGFEP
jgi:hypothetical protein